MTRDLRQLSLEVSHRFTKRDAAILVTGAYAAVAVGLLIGWVQS